MKFFISGGSGYIGVNLRKHIADNYDDCDWMNYDQTAGFDILDERRLYRQMKNCDAVIHLAAIPDVSYCERNVLEAVDVNVYGTRIVAENAQILGLPIVMSSTFAAKSAHNVYGMTKNLAERFVLKANGVVLRFSNVYGGLGYLTRKHTVMANFIGRKKAGIEATIFGDGSAKRDFIHVSDVCDAIVKALGAPPGIYEICTGKKTSIKELADMIEVPYTFGSQRRGDIKEVPGEPSYEALKWKPKVTLEEGLKELLEE